MFFRYTHIDMNFVLRAEPTTNHTSVSKIAQNYFTNAIIYVCSWLFMSFGTSPAQQPNSSHFIRNQKSCNYSWRQLAGHLRRSQKLNLLFFPSSAAFYLKQFVHWWFRQTHFAKRQQQLPCGCLSQLLPRTWPKLHKICGDWKTTAQIFGNQDHHISCI